MALFLKILERRAIFLDKRVVFVDKKEDPLEISRTAALFYNKFSEHLSQAFEALVKIDVTLEAEIQKIGKERVKKAFTELDGGRMRLIFLEMERVRDKEKYVRKKLEKFKP